MSNGKTMLSSHERSVHGTRALPCNTSWCHPHSARNARPQPSVAGRGPHPSPGPLLRCLSRFPCRRRSQHGVGLRLFATLALVYARCSRRLRTRTLSVRRCKRYSSGFCAVVVFPIRPSGEWWAGSVRASPNLLWPDRGSAFLLWPHWWRRAHCADRTDW